MLTIEVVHFCTCASQKLTVIRKLVAMSYLYPNQQTLLQTFSYPLAPRRQQRAPAPSPKPIRASPSPYQARPELYGAFSVIDDAKTKATKEFEKASAKAQSAAGGIELYSAKFYAACTFGGLIACVSFHPGAVLACCAK